MDLSATLTHDLAALATFLPFAPQGTRRSVEEPDDLAQLVELLHDGAATAVGSLLGLSITITLHGQDVVLTSMGDQGQSATVTSSLLVPLSVLSLTATGWVVFYASTPGALVDLAADLNYALGVHHDELVLDQHLPANPVSGLTGVRDLTVVNLAVGILIDRGHTAPDAERELQRLANAAGLEPRQMADQILAGAITSPS